MEAFGTPTDVLSRYQKLIMARENAYESERHEASVANETVSADEEDGDARPLRYTYRHGDGSAEILGVELLNAAHRPMEFVESGEAVRLRVRLRFDAEDEAPVCGFLLHNRHGVRLYGTNTELQRVDFGPVRQGETVEVTFEFNCWLAPDTYSVSVAAHSSTGISFDWLDGVLFFRVMSVVAMEGVTNLNASARARSLGFRATQGKAGAVEVLR
jgi:hypothetical protein